MNVVYKVQDIIVTILSTSVNLFWLSVVVRWYVDKRSSILLLNKMLLQMSTNANSFIPD